MALPINIEDLLNQNTALRPDFIGDVPVDVLVNVPVEPADRERIIEIMSQLCPSYVPVVS